MRQRAMNHPAAGLAAALASAAAFGGSGPFVKPLLEAGWSPGAAVAVRAAAAGLVLLPFGLASVGWQMSAITSAWRRITLFGLVAVVGTQFGYFAAIERLPVGVALLIEYLGPVMLVLYTWFTTRLRPSSVTLVGAVVATGGLFLVLDLTGATSLDPIGVAWALGAAVCLACYFSMAAKSDSNLPTLALASAGLLVGAVATALMGLIGVVPFATSARSVDLLGSSVGWFVPMAVIVLISTSFAYVTGMVGATRLGSRVASFVALVEVLFAVLLSWLVNDEVPTVLQAGGGALIVLGVVLVRAGHTAELETVLVSGPLDLDEAPVDASTAPDPTQSRNPSLDPAVACSN